MTLSTAYDKDYYDQHKAVGMDYLGHGGWQRSVAIMLREAMQQEDYEHPLVLDIGCACGSIIKAVKDVLGCRVIGVDMSEYMVKLGRERFGFSESELRAGNAKDLDIPNGCVSLITSFVTLEHIPEDEVDDLMRTFRRVLVPGGRMFLCIEAIKRGETLEEHMHDSTHYNMKPMLYWGRKFQEHGFVFDVESYDRYARSSETFFHQYR